MTKTMKRSLSLVLVIAMILTLGISALAVTTTPTGMDLYTSDNQKLNDTTLRMYTGQVDKTIKAVIQPSDFSGQVSWDSSNTSVATVSANTAATNGTAENTIKLGTTTGQTTIRATVTDGGSVTYQKSFTLYVSADAVESFTLSPSGTVYLKPAGGADVTATVKYLSGKTEANQNVSWSSSDTSVAKVDSTGHITAVKVGSATVSATAGSSTAQVPVVVTAVNSVSVTKTGTTATSATIGVSDTVSLTAVPTDASGKTPSYGSVTWTSDNAAAAVSYNGLTAVVTGKSIGTANITCYIDGQPGTFAVTVNNTSKTINVSTSMGTNVSLNGARNTIVSNFYNAYGASLTDSSQITLTVPSSKTGVLYNNSYINSGNAVTVGKGTFTLASLSAMYFAPTASGTYEIPYTLTFSGKTMAGSILITVADIVTNPTATVPVGGSAFGLDSTNSYTDVSIQKQLTNAISNLDYVVFNTATATGTACGSLSVASGNTTKYYISTSLFSSEKKLSSLSFTPTKVAGTFSIGFIAYDSSNTKVAAGTMSISVYDVNNGNVSVYYNVKTGSTTNLNEDNFISWYQSQLGASYSLYSVKFNSTPTAGSLKRGVSNVSTSTQYYTTSHVTGSNYKLNDVKYAAPSTTGCYPVSFTCTGKLSSTGADVKRDGTMYLCVTKGDVNVISYGVNSKYSQGLNEADFSSVYNTAVSATGSNKFTVRFVTMPTMGTMYRGGYVSAGYRIYSNDYAYGVNGTSTAYSVSGINYVPGNYTTGKDTVVYAAYDNNGTMRYIGSLTFDYGTVTGGIMCYAEGHTFSKTDFASGTGTSSLSTVSFAQPTSGGTLYKNYKNGSGTVVIPTDKFYVGSKVSGASDLATVTFIPKAGFTGNVTVSYSGVTNDNKSVSDTLIIQCNAKTFSANFKDVTAAWAAGAVDYCSAWGLVNGTNATAKQFTPGGTMTRAMLVTILYRMAGSPSANYSYKFSDIDGTGSSWYKTAVVWANHNGYVNGTSATTFSPNSPVTRQDIASILWRYAGKPTSTGSIYGYTDAANVSSYAVAAMQWAVGAGIITGNGSYLYPTHSGTRAEVAVMLHRYLAR